MNRLKTYILSFGLLFFGMLTNAQSLTEGDNLINISLGMGNLTRPKGFTTVLPPTVFQFEHALSDLITLGGYLGYSVSSFENEGMHTIPVYPYFYEYQKYRWNARNILFGGKATYHFGEALNTSKKLDPYFGVCLGYNAISVNRKQLEGTFDLEPILSPEPESRIMFDVFVGARYYMNEKIGLFGELGYSTAVLQLGITYKIPK